MIDLPPCTIRQGCPIEDRQEINLHNNWADRHDLATKIGSGYGYDIFDWRNRDGRRVFYIVRDNNPLGYIACWIDFDGHTTNVNSTFISDWMRDRGLATMAYKIIINHVGCLVSDFDRSAGGEALWQKLSRDPTLKVDRYEDNRYIGTSRKD